MVRDVGDRKIQIRRLFVLRVILIANFLRPVPPKRAMSRISDDKWDRVFSTNREFKEDWSRSFVDQKRDIGAAGEGIEIFLQDYEDSGLDDKVEELMNFAAGVTLQQLEQGAESAGIRRGAWLDERSVTGEKRDHKNPLTATQLHQRRKVRVSTLNFKASLLFGADEMGLANWSRE